MNLRLLIKVTEKRFGVINISKNGMKGLFQLGNDNLSVYDVARLLNELLEENEQLKATIKEVTELLSEEVDVFSEKATEHDIIAYEELKELDNKDAFYMATATKEAIKILKRCLND